MVLRRVLLAIPPLLVSVKLFVFPFPFSGLSFPRAGVVGEVCGVKTLARREVVVSAKAAALAAAVKVLAAINLRRLTRKRKGLFDFRLFLSSFLFLFAALLSSFPSSSVSALSSASSNSSSSL